MLLLNYVIVSTRPRRHGPHESLFLALVENPAAAASAGLADFGEARALTAAAAAPA
jgi:hypothetical protein